jgi:ribokinase
VDRDARLTVLGSLNMDISVIVRELPGPGATVLGDAAVFAPGGKGANQAVAAARLGSGAGIAVRMVGCVGDDDFGRALRTALRSECVDAAAVRTVDGAPTGIAMITVDAAGENTIAVAPGANRDVGAAELAALADPVANVLVISAEVPVPTIIAALGARAGLTVVNLAPAPSRAQAAAVLAARPDWLVVNEPEAAAVLGAPVRGLAAAASAAAGLVAAGARNAVVTAGPAGAAFHSQGTGFHSQGTGKGQSSGGTVAAFPVHAIDTVGAGDTFVGALAVALAAGVPAREALAGAAAAAATAATRPGAQPGMPRSADIRATTGYEWPL